MRLVISAIGISAALAGCESAESFYPKEQAFLRGSPAMRRNAIGMLNAPDLSD